MKGNIGILMVIAVMYPSCQWAWGITAASSLQPQEPALTVEALAGRLEAMSPFSATVNYAVSLPMAEDDVVYTIDMAADTAGADRFSPVRYLIEWNLPRAEETSNGFLAYFGGHHYRYRDHRLQEYHTEWDSIPFLTGDGGVQRNGQFVELLPQSIAASLKMMWDSLDYSVQYDPEATVDGRDVSVVTATQTANGYVGRNYRLIVDRYTCRPLKIENEYNPGAISEQSVTASYTYPSGNPDLTAVSSEEQLMALYPEVFEKFRESNYRIENMRGLPLPGFSLPTLTGERYSRQKGDHLRAPAVLAIIDPANDSAGATVTALRKAQEAMPREVLLIFAFMGSNTDIVEEVAGTPAAGEYDLISAKSLARDCGTSVFPTIMVVDSEGTVTNVMLGFNNSIGNDVIQSLALVK